MPQHKKLLIWLGALSLSLVNIASAHDVNAAADPALKMQLERLSKLKVYFGHQSVGGNLLDGLRQISEEQGVAVSIKEVQKAADVKIPEVAHVFVAENRDPLGKLAAFNRALDGGGVDVAMVKFCYVDFAPDTNSSDLFRRYQETINALRLKNPHTVFVHATTPLTTVQTGYKATLKKLMGHAPYGVEENMRRNEYNNLLRSTYQGKEPIFDIANFEATGADGAPLAYDWNGMKVPYLNPAYTSDGGHLNNLARRKAAREMVSVWVSALAQ